MSPGEEIPQVDKLAMPLVFHIDHTPSVLASPHRLTIDDYVTLRANDGERNHVPDALVQLKLLFIVLIVIERIKPDVVIH